MCSSVTFKISIHVILITHLVLYREALEKTVKCFLQQQTCVA